MNRNGLHEGKLNATTRTNLVASHIIVPSWVADQTMCHLYEKGHPNIVGRSGSIGGPIIEPEEGIAVWYGFFARPEYYDGPGDLCAYVEGVLLVDGPMATSMTTVIPAEVLEKFDGELAAMNKGVRNHGSFFISLVHSHPGSFGCSKTDKATLLNFGAGMFSLIVPNYAESDDILRGSYLYACAPTDEGADLIELDPRVTIQIVDTSKVYDQTMRALHVEPRKHVVERKREKLWNKLWRP
nr:hypothetical protein [Candidatus Sigynarchaeota archaeon]